MPVTIEERWDSRSANLAKQGTQVQLRHISFGSGSQLEVEIYAAAYIPAFAITALGNTLIRQQIQTKQITDTIFEITTTYGDINDPKSQDPPQTGDGLYSFDTTATTAHVDTSIQTRMQTFTNGPEFGGPDEPGPIGVADQGAQKKIKGCDVLIPTLKFSRTHYLALEFVTVEYVKQLSRNTAKMNSATWQGFEAGELLFLGATGQKRADNWEVKFDFAASENIHPTDEFWGHELGAPPGSASARKVEMKGWDHFWVYHRETQVEQEIVPVPYCGYVSQIYYDFDFTTLGIGS